MFELKSTDQLEHEFSAANRGLPDDEIALRDRLSFRTIAEARFAYEYFCFRSAFMARELDNFLFLTRRRTTLLDIGCLFGVFSFAFCLSRGRRSMAVDPSPEAMKVLRENRRLNPDCEIQVAQLALGAAEGIVSMKKDWLHLVATIDDATSIPVPTRSGDALLDDLRYRPDVIKIDVEGYENRVLEGLRQTLFDLRPDIHIEVHPDHLAALGSSATETRRLLDGLNYVIYGMDGREIASVPENGREHCNWYCIHRQGDLGGLLPIKW